MADGEHTKQEDYNRRENWCEEDGEPDWNDLIRIVRAINARFEKGELCFVPRKEAEGGCCYADDATFR